MLSTPIYAMCFKNGTLANPLEPDEMSYFATSYNGQHSTPHRDYCCFCTFEKKSFSYTNPYVIKWSVC